MSWPRVIGVGFGTMLVGVGLSPDSLIHASSIGLGLYFIVTAIHWERI